MMMYEFLLMKSWYTGNQRIKIAMHIPLAEDIFLTLEADGVRVEIVIPAVKEILLQNGTGIHMMSVSYTHLDVYKRQPPE